MYSFCVPIGTTSQANFFEAVRCFYTKCVQKMVDKFPFADKTIADLKILDPECRIFCTAAQLVRLVQRFTVEIDVDEITKEFQVYRTMPADELPESESLEEFWAKMGQLTARVQSNIKRFSHLSKFCKLLLVLPHSTAAPERLFSMVGKIETSQRGSLLPSTVCKLLSVKMNSDEPCYATKTMITPRLLTMARNATKQKVAARVDV